MTMAEGDRQNADPEGPSIWRRAGRVGDQVLVTVVLALMWASIVVLILVELSSLVLSANPTDKAALISVLALPVVVGAVGSALVYLVWRLRWLWLPLTLVLAAAGPLALLGKVVESKWPEPAPVAADQHCPTPAFPASGAAPYFPAPASVSTDASRYPGGGGLPTGFVPVSATRCLIVSVTTPVGGHPTAVVREQSATASAGLSALVLTLRHRSDVLTGTSHCPQTAAAGAPGHLILTDADGNSYLVGFPTDKCGVPHADVVAAFSGLPWKTVSEGPVQEGG
jgi:hypothetical protein